MKKNYIKPTVTVAHVALTSMIASSLTGTNVGLGMGGNTNGSVFEGNAKRRVFDDDDDELLEDLW